VSVPFNSISNAQVFGRVDGNSTFYISSGLYSQAYDLGLGVVPYGSTGAMSNPFGIGISNIAKAYARYRVRKLRVTYVPIVGTAAVGSFVLGATSENYITNFPINAQTAADCQVSMTTPVWQEASMDLSSLLMTDKNPEWFYTYVADSSDASQRQNFCCTLLSAGIGMQNVSTYGYLRFDGVIEFTSLSDIVGGAAAFSPSPSVNPESPLHVITEESTACVCKSQCPASQQAPDCKRGWLG
jgi:hypothetical protein